MPVKIAINGLGRIGRLTLRRAFTDSEVEVVAANSRSSAELYAHLIKYDSSYGVWKENIFAKDKDTIVIDGKELKLFHELDPSVLPWGELGIDVVIESTGVFKNRVDSEKHLQAGAKKVLISAPAKDEDVTLVRGVNLSDYDPEKHRIISAASCTSNCLAPIVKVLQDKIGIVHGFMTTIHAYTNDQNLVDAPHGKEDLRRSRAACESIIPTTTGATKTIGKLIPALKGKLSGISLRVPVVLPSVINLSLEMNQATTVEEVNGLLKQAAENEFKGIMDFSLEPLVSVDYKGDAHGSIVDGLSTAVIDDKLVNIVAWYDNEWGYVSQMVELIKYIAREH